MKFSYNWLKELSGTKLSPEKLVEILTLRSFELKEIKQVCFDGSISDDGASGYSATKMKQEGKDFVMDIDVLPNRASDCFSHIGIAREIAAITNLKFKISNLKLQAENRKGKTKTKLKTKNLISVEVKDKEGCPRYTAMVVTGVAIGQSPEWLQKKLNVCGIQSINNVVDATNYVMLEMGQPLHAFDLDKLAEKNAKKAIIVRKAEIGEKLVSLDDKKYDLDKTILMIADAKEPLALAGIKGGKKAEIDSATKNIVIESANFSRQNIYQTSKKINLRTDASLRFGSGLDPNLTEEAIIRVANLIQEISGGTISQGIIDVYPKKNLPKKIKLDLKYVEKLLGIKISASEVKRILTNLGFVANGSAILNITVPTRRTDVVLPEDLIEEIGRIYGYEKIPAVLPMAALVPSKRNESIFWEDVVKDTLQSAGFTEVYNYSFIDDKAAKSFGFKEEELLALENPMSAEQSFLRPSLIPGLVKNTGYNLNQFKEIMIFEIGKVFRKNYEQKMISGIMTGDKFYEVKGILDFLFSKAGIADVWYAEYQQTLKEKNLCWWNYKKCGEIKFNQATIGYIGEISQKILNDFKVGTKVVYFDIFFDKLFKVVSEDREYRPISKYPSAIRDIAVLVPQATRVQDVSDIIEGVGGGIVRDADVFDIYEGDELPDGKKNLAFHIIYQSDDRTLSSKEIDEVQNKIIQNLEKNVDWEVRK